ncbi:hypothetical protein ALC57_15944 [Trachymyrmex cornetzi]|uniref:Uncharacterized protein n=1 Tax=Trachymyrmex cornetzi TaxID=471704 RepID=A0A195DFY3_9HYME|nr:hypothetical protein ALC57_15944 [Trachymyrmex cornetzi]
MKGDNGQEGPGEKTEGQWGGEESCGSKGGNGLLYQTPEISNRPREFAWELWERHDKHQTQEYPMYALAYCARKPVGSSVPGVEVEREEKSGTNYRGWIRYCSVTTIFVYNGHFTKPRSNDRDRLWNLSTPPNSTGRQPPEAPLPLTAGRIPPPPGSGAYGKYSSSLRMSLCTRVEEQFLARSSPFARFYLF